MTSFDESVHLNNYIDKLLKEKDYLEGIIDYLLKKNNDLQTDLQVTNIIIDQNIKSYEEKGHQDTVRKFKNLQDEIDEYVGG